MFCRHFRKLNRKNPINYDKLVDFTLHQSSSLFCFSGVFACLIVDLDQIKSYLTVLQLIFRIIILRVVDPSIYPPICLVSKKRRNDRKILA